MSTHDASEQMIGYLYQVRYALALLLKNDNPNYQISIEKFDDVAFVENDIPKQLIQVKHHVKKYGDLTDMSTDLWRTLKVWIDIIIKSPGLVNDTNFLIITTAAAPNNTAAFYLKENINRDVDKAYGILKNVCVESKSKENKKYYEVFLKMDQNIIRKLISKIFVVDGASNIINVEKDIRNRIRYSCVPKFENAILERLEGWWYAQAIKALCSDSPVFVNQNQVRFYIASLSKEYSDDDLPIDVFDVDLENIQPSDNENILCEQLKLLNFKNHRMQRVLRDYYRAFQQRANWVRNDLLYMNELEKYESELIDEWEHCFIEMEDDLSMCSNITENEKVEKGRKLFSELENKNFRIRPKCDSPFVMRGRYHILASRLRIGWHIDFEERLKYLLNLEENDHE